LGNQECPLQPEEIKKLTRFLRTKFELPKIEVRRRPQKTDSAEVYIGEEFIGVIFRDEEDGELSYNFSMAILDFDLE
jgi:Protein of unknown function (DUF3126)